MEFKDIIAKIFKKRGFKEGFYKPWFGALGAMKPRELQTLVELMEDASKKDLQLWTEVLKQKSDALQTQDLKKWDEIIKRERKYILE